MKLLKLNIVGWGPYKDSQQIDFSPVAEGGLFLITGPTGAGKTTIFDAVTFALYGEVSGSVREKDSLRSDFAAADCATQVELTFWHRGEVYRILRNPRYDRAKLRGEGTTTENENAQMHRGGSYAGRGNTGGGNTGGGNTGGGNAGSGNAGRGSADRGHSGGGETDQAELVAVGSQQVTEAVTELLGLDYRQFKQISMIAQGEFTKLLMASSKERTLIFRDIFQTRLYDVITQILGRRAHALNAKLDEVKHRMDETAGAFRVESEAWEKAWNQKSRNYGKLAELAEADCEMKKEARVRLAEQQEKLEKEYKALVRRAEQARQNNRAIDAYLADMASLEQMKQALAETKERKKELQKEEKKLPGMEQELAEFKEFLRSLKEQYERIGEWKRMKARLTSLQERYLLLDRQAKQKKAEFEAQDDRYRKASAGILAQNLKAGLPCPVCGSTEHPAPAHLTDEIPDEKKLEKLKQEAERQTGLANQAQAEAAGALGALKQVERNLADLMGREARAAEQTEVRTSSDAGGSMTEVRADGLLAKLQDQIVWTDKSCIQLENEIQRIKKSCQDTELLFEKQKSAVTQKKESIKKPASLEKEELSGLAKQEQEQESLRRQLAKEKEKLQTVYNINQSCLKQLREHMQQRQLLEEEYGVVQKVSRAASGSNMRKLVLEQYVLSVYFDDILRAANQRLRMMTGDRYELYRLEEGKDRRMKEGMELEVMDQYTGKKRSVKTLSGGESFKAALALALGTSDVVQGYAGGIQVETMFVDEGFGALDSESLSQAVDILASLGDSRRMIGIISHVEELKERIENQIIVEKSNNGSSIKTNFVVS